MSAPISNTPKQAEAFPFMAKIHGIFEVSAHALRRLIRLIRDLIERIFHSFRPSPKVPPLPQKKLPPEPPPIILQVPPPPPTPQVSPPPQPTPEQVGIFTIIRNYFPLIVF